MSATPSSLQCAPPRTIAFVPEPPDGARAHRRHCEWKAGSQIRRHTIVEAEHRQHAVVELTIRDLKDQALAHFPSGQFAANSAWTVIACLAHNLTRWTTVIGLPGDTVRAARTLRRRLLNIPGRLTRTARQWTLHLPARWPWQHDFTRALARIRALPTAI